MTPDSFVTIGLPNGIEFFEATIARVEARRDAAAGLAPAAAGRARGDHRARRSVPRRRRRPGRGRRTAVGARGLRARRRRCPTTPLEPRIAASWKAPTSGGSTGRPKLIVSGQPGVLERASPPGALGRMTPDGVASAHRPAVPQRAVPAVDRRAVPRQPRRRHAALRRRAGAGADRASPRRLDVRRADDDAADLAPARRGAAALRRVVAARGAAPGRAVSAVAEARRGSTGSAPRRSWSCTPAPRRRLVTFLDGDEWLAHRGSVGRPVFGEMKILDADGDEAAAGRDRRDLDARGRTAHRRATATSAPRRRRDGDGWESLGDIGRLDEDGLPLPRRPRHRHDPRRRRERLSRPRSRPR